MNAKPFLFSLVVAGVLATGGMTQGCAVAFNKPKAPQPACQVVGARMRCQTPDDDTFTLPAPPVAFTGTSGSGSYTIHSGRETDEAAHGALVSFEGGPTYDVGGPLFSAWLGGTSGRGTVADALAARTPASNWGVPLGNATCDGNPCKLLKQSFAHGEASLPLGGGVIWTPTEEGLTPPINVGTIERGYSRPPIPYDRRAPTGPRSGDYIKLVWRNMATLAGVTTTLHRSVTPLNGPQGAWTAIHTFPPPTLASGSFSVFTDESPTNNARNCYFLSVSDGSATARSTATCGYTMDGTTVAGVDRSVPRTVSRAQLRIQVPASPADSSTATAVGVRLESFAGGFNYNLTYLDSTAVDFTLGSDRTYDLLLTGIEDLSDIVGITVTSYRDNLRVSAIELILDNVKVYSRAFDPPALVDNSDLPGGSSLVVSFNELRSNPLWNSLYQTDRRNFFGFDREAFKAKLDGILGNAVLGASGSAYYRSGLQDGSTTTVSKPAGYLRDRVRVTQHIRASAADNVTCSLSYDLRLATSDIFGNPVSPFWNGPFVQGLGQGIIYSTQINLENSSVSCSSTFWNNVADALLKASPFPSPLNTVEDKVRGTLEDQGPTQLSAPPPHQHFCFPGSQEGVPGALFWNGGLTACADAQLGNAFGGP